MTWNDGLSIGVPAIDAQHKTLCEKIDNLLEACKTGKGRIEIINTLTFLEDYTKKHFHDEEILQKSSGYPKCAEHKKIHENFIKSVSELKNEISQNGPSIVSVGKVNTLIIDWLVNHIKKVDKELAVYVK